MDEIQAFYDEVFPLRRGSGRLHRQVRLLRTAARGRREPAQPALLADHRLAGGGAVEAAAGKAFGQHHSHESELTPWDSPPRNSTSSTSPRRSAARSGPTSTRCSAAGKPRTSAPRSSSAEWSSSAAWTSATSSRSPSPRPSATSSPNEGEDGIYKISLDKNVNQRAEYLKGSLFWHFDGSLQPYPNLATLLRAIKLSDTGGRHRVLQHLCRLRRPAASRQGRHRRPSGGAQRRAVAVLRDARR